MPNRPDQAEDGWSLHAEALTGTIELPRSEYDLEREVERAGEIVALVSEELGVEPAVILSNRRDIPRRSMAARRIATLLVFEYTLMSPEEVARAFGHANGLQILRQADTLRFDLEKEPASFNVCFFGIDESPKILVPRLREKLGQPLRRTQSRPLKAVPLDQ